jgi:hypothetical protein
MRLHTELRYKLHDITKINLKQTDCEAQSELKWLNMLGICGGFLYYSLVIYTYLKPYSLLFFSERTRQTFSDNLIYVKNAPYPLACTDSAIYSMPRILFKVFHYHVCH